MLGAVVVIACIFLAILSLSALHAILIGVQTHDLHPTARQRELYRRHFILRHVARWQQWLEQQRVKSC